MTDSELIDEAYGAIVRNLFSNFFHSFTAALGNPDEEQQAAELFRKGVMHARHVRERALAALP